MRPARRPRRPVERAMVGTGRVDVSKVGVSRFDFRDPYHAALTASWPRFTVALFLLYFAINILFASLYAARPGSVANARPGSIEDNFFFSLETLATVGYGQMYPATTYGHIVSAAEIMSGMAFMAIMTGLIFVRFSKPRAKILYADKLVMTTYNGVPALMLRIANGRLSMLTDLNIRLNALLPEATSEGHHFRRVHELKLVRSYVPMFAMTMTVVHMVDNESPLAGLSFETMLDRDLRFFLSVEAHDVAINSTVHDLRDYLSDQIAFNMRYVDAVTVDDDGRTIADLTRLSLIEPDTATFESTDPVV